MPEPEAVTDISGLFTYCTYCSVQFRADLPDAIQAVTDHIWSCDQHPMAQLINELRVASTVCSAMANPNDTQEWDWAGLASRFENAMTGHFVQ